MVYIYMHYFTCIIFYNTCSLLFHAFHFYLFFLCLKLFPRFFLLCYSVRFRLRVARGNFENNRRHGHGHYRRDTLRAHRVSPLFVLIRLSCFCFFFYWPSLSFNSCISCLLSLKCISFNFLEHFLFFPFFPSF